MRVTLKIAYPKLPPETDEVKTTAALWRHAVNQKYSAGLGRIELRLWSRIEDELDKGEPEIDVSIEQWKFVFEAVRGAMWPPSWARHAVALLDHMDEVERSL